MSNRDRNELRAQLARALAEGKMDIYRQLLDQLARGTR